MTEKRKRAYRLGIEAEEQAAGVLRDKGWSILTTRYKTKVGEVDLIARKDNLVIFVEVKARKNQTVALESVSEKSKKRIKAAGAEWLLELNDPMVSWRCDLVVIVPDSAPVHIEGAW